MSSPTPNIQAITEDLMDALGRIAALIGRARKGEDVPLEALEWLEQEMIKVSSLLSTAACDTNRLIKERKNNGSVLRLVKA
jgi:hypothetical protein